MEYDIAYKIIISRHLLKLKIDFLKTILFDIGQDI